jgi:hypothetical protein
MLDRLPRRNVFEIPFSGRTPKSASRSLLGAQKAARDARTLREQVFEFISNRGSVGATDREIQRCLGIKGDTQRPRRWELWKAGRIRVRRKEDGDLRYRYEGIRVKSVVWVVGCEKTCPYCGSVYTKTKMEAPA